MHSSRDADSARRLILVSTSRLTHATLLSVAYRLSCKQTAGSLFLAHWTAGRAHYASSCSTSCSRYCKGTEGMKGKLEQHLGFQQPLALDEGAS